MVAYARARVITYAVFTVDGVDYANQITKLLLTPEQPIQTIRTMVPDGQVQDVDSATWTFALAGIQDFGTGSLGKALRDAANAGVTVDVVFQPHNGVGQDRSEFVMTPLQIPFGGEQGAFRTFDVTLPVVGAPVFTQSI